MIAKLVGGTPTSSEGAWYTNIALLSRAISSGRSDVEVKEPPILFQAEKEKEEKAAELKASTSDQKVGQDVEALDEVKKQKEKERIERESRGDHSEF